MLKRLLLRDQRLQRAKMFSVFRQRRLGVREAVEQRELPFRREKRLVIVRAVQIDQLVADRFQNARVAGEPLTNCRLLPPNEKLRFKSSSSPAGSTPASSSRGFSRAKSPPAKIASTVHDFRAGADERLLRALA